MAPILREAVAPAHTALSLRSLAPALSSIFTRSISTLKRSLSNLRTSSDKSALITSRQENIQGIIPAQYQDINAGPAPGTVVGIVLGSVAGFLLIVWLLWSVTNLGAGANITGEEEIVIRKSPRSRRSRHSRSTREMREVSRSPRRERVIVEDREFRRTSMPPPPRARSRSIHMEERVEHRVDGDDIVEVIEEASDFSDRPKRNHRRRNSGYRSVDPSSYAGGDYPQHRI